MTQRAAPFGSWESPITTDLITKGAVGFSGVALDGDDIYWVEQRPWEKGRGVLVRQRGEDGTPVDLTPEPLNVRSRVHEYGGGAFTVADGEVWFSNGGDDGIRHLRADGTIHELYREAAARFADFAIDPPRGRLICVEERAVPGHEPENRLVSITFGGVRSVIAEGADFYAGPNFSPDGSRLAWIEWDHPNMPWDGTCCREALLQEDGSILAISDVAGGPNESVFQPAYSPDGTLYYVSDASGFWNLYRSGEEPAHFNVKAEFGLPLWQFGMRTYGFLDADRIAVTFAQNGDWRLGFFDLKAAKLTPVETGWCRYPGITVSGGKIAFIGESVGAPPAVAVLDLNQRSERIVKSSADLKPREGDVSVARKVSFESRGGRAAHAYYYPPANAAYKGLEGEAPPLIVKGHGGPTGQTSPGYSLKIQYWTSRGFAVLDVDYGGSTGYGRDYRQLLDGQWGIVDVEDCVAGAEWAAREGLADPKRLAISGGSAGGYTVLSALAFHDTFKAGTSSYGIGDLEALARDTHKFESRYLDRLIGPYPEEIETYKARSPLNHADSLDCPVLFLQGADDKVVPPNQAETMHALLKEKAIPTAYILFEGEGHGFRQAANIEMALKAELSFYGQVFGFEPAGIDHPVEIAGL